MRIVIGVVIAIVALLAGASWYLSIPDIPRSVLEAKYGGPPSQFITISYPGTLAHDASTPVTPCACETRVRVRDVGPRNAQTIVLIHGSNASLETWEPWVKRLSDKFRVVTFDLPGHGLTGAVPSGDYSEAGMVAFTKAVVDKLHLPLFVIGGNSMGGGVAARFAETYPTRVTHLILIDAAGMKFSGGDGWLNTLAKTPVLGNLLLTVTPRSLVVAEMNKAIGRKNIIDDAMVDRYWHFALMAGTREATLARFRLPHDTTVATHTAQITAQTLILWGADDRLIPVARAHLWAEALPGSRLIIYPATGHIPMEEVADQSAKDVRDFLIAPITPPQPY